MSNFHILDQADDGKTINVVFHVPIPATNNAVGVSYQTALVALLGGSDAITTHKGAADATELIDLKAGVKAEIVTSVRFSTIIGLSDEEKLAEIEQSYSDRVEEFISDYGFKLSYWGFAGDVT